jgi:hypothetical protein
MAEKNPNRNEQDRRQKTQDQDSTGNQQKTSQTGAQNAGGKNIDQDEDQYNNDIRKSGDRNSSNRKTGG